MIEWERQWRRVRPKEKEKPKRSTDRIRIRSDAFIMKQKAESMTYAETLQLMKSKVNGAFAGGKFNKSGEVLIELQEGVKAVEVQQSLASFLAEDGVVRELQQAEAVDISNIDLDNTRAKIAKTVQDACLDREIEEIIIKALRLGDTGT
ncbi:hypothetical protein QAD02_001322 [Eretmocerus hayati]|uniref:Uncharacterized protein n=1 Tax=Eretmocerus hayati TaxID=131215 RepID=A0ACC2NGM8_9HYME|nr:hypothetical protein QAD02_001322 [Eretmocerus hayati]